MQGHGTGCETAWDRDAGWTGRSVIRLGADELRRCAAARCTRAEVPELSSPTGDSSHGGTVAAGGGGGEMRLTLFTIHPSHPSDPGVRVLVVVRA